MRPPRTLLSSFTPLAALLALAASLANASHVAPVFPLTRDSNHAHEQFSPTNFPAGNYSNFDFSFADLSGCTFAAGTNLTGASFRGANVTNTDFSGCQLDLADFSGANLTNAHLPCMGGGKFNGAILTGAAGSGEGCDGSARWGPNEVDACAVGPLPALRFASRSFRGLVAGVVFSDENRNGQLDFGEPGVPGALVYFSSGPDQVSTDERGGFSVPVLSASSGMVAVTPPDGWDLTGPAVQRYNPSECRSSQQLGFPAISVGIQPPRSTFGQVKARYH